jgi:hypothetical protein
MHRIRLYLNRLAGSCYLSIKVADEYPEQEPAFKCAKWYDLFHFMIPVVGWFSFILAIEDRFCRDLAPDQDDGIDC